MNLIFDFVFAITLLQFVHLNELNRELCNIDYLYKYFGTKSDYDEVRGVNNEQDFQVPGVNKKIILHFFRISLFLFS
jgi:hypothetical protein